MPSSHRTFTECKLTDIQEKMASQLHLSPQTSLLLAIMVYHPVATRDLIYKHFGEIDHRNLAARLRNGLHRAESDITVHTVTGLGFNLDPKVRVSLAGLEEPLSIPRPIHEARVRR